MDAFEKFMAEVMTDADVGRAKVTSKEFGEMFDPTIIADTNDLNVMQQYLAGLDFSLIEERILASMVAGKQPGVIIGLDTTSIPEQATITVAIQKEDVLHVLFIDEIRKQRYDGPQLMHVVDRVKPDDPMRQKIRGLAPTHYILDDLVEEVTRRLSPLDQQEPESDDTAKNGMKANRKTADAKAKLPFYHKNRRF